jgi:hypothetical protein
LLTLWVCGYIDLYFCDESGFTLQPYIPYAWQKKGQTIRLFARNKRHRLNVLGFMSLDNRLHVYHCVRDRSGSPQGWCEVQRSTERSEPTHSPTPKVGIGYKMIRRPHHLFSLYAAATLVDMQRTFIVHQATGTYTGPFGGTAPINLAVPFYSRILGIGVTPTLDYRYVFNDKLFVGVYVEGDFYINPVLWGSRKHGLKIGVQF